ncbi:hypothetical protein BC826DRAFT_972564 [Russula brevipes]|nr:hypothetical protein BC826DRAFT_972564 [Russula brevipes]
MHIRKFLYEGWRMVLVVDLVPALTSAHILFFLGLSDFLFKTDTGTATTTTIVTVICAHCYLLSIVAPVQDAQPRYGTEPSIRHFWQYDGRAHAIKWAFYYFLRRQGTGTAPLVRNIAGSIKSKWGRGVWEIATREKEAIILRRVQCVINRLADVHREREREGSKDDKVAKTVRTVDEYLRTSWVSANFLHPKLIRDVENKDKITTLDGTWNLFGWAGETDKGDREAPSDLKGSDQRHPRPSPRCRFYLEKTILVSSQRKELVQFPRAHTSTSIRSSTATRTTLVAWRLGPLHDRMESQHVCENTVSTISHRSQWRMCWRGRKGLTPNTQHPIWRK